MRYMGGKARAGKHIAGFLNDALQGRKDFYEPFVGGCNLLKHITTDGRVTLSDVNSALGSLYSAYREGWEPPEFVSEDEYAAAKDLPNSDPTKAFVAICGSFGCKWFGGYARGGGRNFFSEGCRNLSKTKLRELKQYIRSGSYDEVIRNVENAVIYCDPPYTNTTGYSATGGFDHDAFWSWCQRMAVGNDVFVSEYACPVPNTCLWEKQQKTTCTTSAYKTATERLFKIEP